MKMEVVGSSALSLSV